MRFSDREWNAWKELPITQSFLRLVQEDIDTAKEMLTEEEGDIPHAKLRGIIAGLRALLEVIPKEGKEKYDD